MEQNETHVGEQASVESSQPDRSRPGHRDEGAASEATRWLSNPPDVAAAVPVDTDDAPRQATNPHPGTQTLPPFDVEQDAPIKVAEAPHDLQDMPQQNENEFPEAKFERPDTAHDSLYAPSIASISQSAIAQPDDHDYDQGPVQEAQLAEEQHLEADELDSDSALGSDTESTTTSLSESIYQYRKEHGRTYHAYKDGKYIFPNDEREADRLDLQHHLFRITFGNHLFFSPLTDPKRAIDVGTGTGIWAVDFADEFPECQVMGIDLSPGQPTLVPPNLKFVIDDAEDLWVYDQPFDFIHLRLMAGCFSDWQNLFRQTYQNLEPGGWLELQDYGLPVKSADNTHLGTDLHRWGELLCEAARALGRPMGSDVSDKYVQYMHDAGFVDIQQRMFMWPSNAWPKDPFMKELGRWNQINILDGLEGFCLALLTRGLGWKKEEVDILVAKVSKDLRDRRIHAYFPMPVTFGRKPFPHEVVFH